MAFLVRPVGVYYWHRYTRAAVPYLEISGWFGMFAVAGTRPEIIARYNDIVVRATRTAGVREKMRALDLDIREMSPAEIAAMLKFEYDRWGPVVKASGFSAESQ